MPSQRTGIKYGIARSVAIIIVVILIILVASGGFYVFLRGSSTTSSSVSTITSSTGSSVSTSTSSLGSSEISSTVSTLSSSISSSTISSSISSSTSSTSTSSSSSTSSVPQVFTWETSNALQYLDPTVANVAYDDNVLQNIYEPLLWYNGTSSTELIPWLAQSYTVSADQKSVNFTLRNGVTFADGDELNSSAVYFTLDRQLIEDSSTPVSHGAGSAFIVQQLLNKSLSWELGAPHNYTQTWANEVLAQNFIQITGPMTFTMNIQNPNAAFRYFIANTFTSIMAPQYVMQHDIALWNQSSEGYSLPYATLSGNISSRIYEYFMDEIATCDSGATPKGCGTTYLDGSYSGSLAGTGPYTVSSFNPSTNDIVLLANPNYWGGPYQTLGGSKIVPQIKTVDINYVQDQTTRDIDLQTAAKSGSAMAIDVTPDHLYDVANRNAWLENETLTSIIPGVSVYGPFTGFVTTFDIFATNVSNPQTGSYYEFQPFSDLRFRLAFSDSVNMTDINVNENNGLGQVANSLIPPGLPPAGGHNTTLATRYSFNLTAVQDLLLDAMLHPIVQFTFANGSRASPGTFNNTFGCATLGSSGTCADPIPQSITLVYPTGDTLNQAIETQIASAINNVSSTYNMGLTVSVTPIPSGFMFTEFFASQLYFLPLEWFADFPWVTDYLGNMFAPNGGLTGPDSWNITEMGVLYQQVVTGTSAGNVSQVISSNAAMNSLGNSLVMYLWEFYPVQAWSNSAVAVLTSNVQGYYYNAGLQGMYFASLY